MLERDGPSQGGAAYHLPSVGALWMETLRPYLPILILLVLTAAFSALAYSLQARKDA